MFTRYTSEEHLSTGCDARKEFYIRAGARDLAALSLFRSSLMLVLSSGIPESTSPKSCFGAVGFIFRSFGRHVSDFARIGASP